MTTRIVLADDHKVVREGLCALLAKDPGLEVIGEAPDGRAAVKLVCKLKPDVAIIDIAMPDLNGIEATKQIVAEAPDVKVLALSMHSDKRYVARMLAAGAVGYLLKDCAFEEIARAIRQVAANRAYLSPKIENMVIEEYVRRLQDDKTPLDSLLTSREREVLQLLAEGVTVKEIAAQLDVSPKTIETLRQHIMQKQDIHTVADLTKYAVREGLTSLDT